jgi:thymidylate kinase
MSATTQSAVRRGAEDRITRVRAISGSGGPFFASAPLSVALVGPDGVGKSTVIRTATEWIACELPGMTVIVRQWRPGLLPSLSSLLGRPENVRQNQGPRRESGRFHAVRLFYYYFDFLLGRLFKDCSSLSKSALIIYDRCALDMAVDPVRFGLRSFRGTRLLWKLVPKPDLLILLYDSPDRIWQRKREINQNEMADQLGIWLRYVCEDQVHAVIRVDAEPQEISLRVQDLLIQTFLRKHERACTAMANESSPLSCIKSICGDEGESGQHLTEFCIVPRASAPRLLIPLKTRKTAANSLGVYNPLRPAARWSTRLLKAALGAGLAQPLLRDRALLHVHLEEHLKWVFGSSRIASSISIGTPGEQQKPVLQVMDADGRVLGYAKVGWNPQTIRLVQNEEISLRKLKGVRFSTAKIPEVVHAGWWKGNYVLVQRNSGPGLQRAVRGIDHRHIDFLVDLYRSANPCELSLRDVPWLTEADSAAIRNEGFHYYLHLLQQAAQYCRDRAGDRHIPCGRAHGDFTPWNIRACGGDLLVIDWEYAVDARPVGWDLFHFLIETAVELQDETPGNIYRMLLHPSPKNRMIRCYFECLGVSGHWIRPALVCYLAAALKESLCLHGQNLSAKDETLRRTWGVLLNLLCYDQSTAEGI